MSGDTTVSLWGYIEKIDNEFFLDLKTFILNKTGKFCSRNKVALGTSVSGNKTVSSGVY